MSGRFTDLVYNATGIVLGDEKFPATRDVESSVASVLALTALSDGSVSTEEAERLVVILRKNFNLEAGSALALITRALHELPGRDAVPALLQELNSLLSAPNKEHLVIMVLEVIAADGRKEAEEMEVLANIVYGLGVSGKSMDRAYAGYFESRRGKADRARMSGTG